MADRLGESDSGMCPRPIVDKSLALSLLKSLYPVERNVEPEILQEYPGYYDRNFHVSVQLETCSTREEYVLKILHQAVSANVEFQAAHAELLLHIRRYGFHCPVPATSREGSLFCCVDLPDKLHDKHTRHAVVLWKFVPGMVMHSVGRPSDALLSSVGCYLAELHDCLGDLAGSSTEAAIRDRQFSWSIVDALECEAGVPFIPDPSLRAMVQSVLDRFRDQIMPRMSLMSWGVIHGDANARNLILDPLDTDAVFGIIDTSDTVYAPFVSDLAIGLVCISFMMISESPCAATAPVVRSYCDKRPLSDLEKDTLHLWALARLAQHLALGYRDCSADPSNDYMLASVRLAAIALPRLFAVSPDQVKDAWFS